MSVKAPHCHIHDSVPMICPACVGQRGGSVTSPRKAAAARRNGRLSAIAVDDEVLSKSAAKRKALQKGADKAART